MSAGGAPVGNSNATKGKPWADSIRRALARFEANPKNGRAALDKLADDLIEKALAGDVEARNELANRLDGRPVQRTEISGPDGEAMAFQDAADVKRKLIAGIAATATGGDTGNAE